MSSDVAASLRAIVDQWRPVLLDLDEATARHKPSPERWSIAEVAGHLVDSACNNHQRFVRARDGDSLTFPKYDQNAWVAAGAYNQADWPALVTLWHAYNLQLAVVIDNIPADRLGTTCMIGPNEPCTLQFLIEDYVMHLQHHLEKIRERLGRQ